jgi:dUTP pyrophosphatase
MRQAEVRFCWLLPLEQRNLPIPCPASSGAAGMDVAAGADALLQPGEISLIPTGFAVALPDGFEFQVRPRSGLAVKHGITVVNAPGTIDADYRGEIKIALINLGRKPYTVCRGDRIAQLVLAPVWQARMLEADTLDATERGGGGFGHTGV